MMKKITLLFAAIIIAFSVSAQSAKSGIQVTDLVKIKDIGNVIMSPDESFAIFSVRSVVDADKKWEYNYNNQWYIVRFEPEVTYRLLTSGKDGFGQPTISPDSKKILFSRGVNGKSQLFIMYLDGGEPVQLTRFEHGASSPRWSPDGSKIVFSTSFSLPEYYQNSSLNPNKNLPLWSLEKPGFEDNSYLVDKGSKADPNGNIDEIRAYLLQNEKDRKAKVINKLRFQGEQSTNSNTSISHLYVVDAEAKTEPIALTSGFYSFGGVQFKDNQTIWVSGRKETDVNPEREQESVVFSINLNTKEMQQVLGEAGKSFRLSAISPDGNTIVYSTTYVDSLMVGDFYIETTRNGRKNSAKLDLDRSMGGIEFDANGKDMYFTSQRNGGNVVYRYDLQGGNLEKLSSDDLGISGLNVGKNRLVYAQTDITNPSELYISDKNLKSPIRVTDLNASWLKDRQLASVEKHTFTNELGLEVEYWVMKPLNYQAGKKYPLVLQIHGGPSAMWGPGESSMWHEYQYFAAQGYGIVYSNPRGSGGYGTKFLQGNYRDWGKGPASDVLTALDKAVAEGWADPNKLLVTGGSYAGYLTNWIISHDHRFLAASAQRGVYHLTTFYGEGNASSLVPRYYGGYPWEPEVRKIIEEQSPYNYVHQIQTPFLIFHGEVDLRTGVIQSEMLYKSLKQLGKTVEYVRHPGANHEITRSGDNRQRIDQMLRTFEFFERYVKSME